MGTGWRRPRWQRPRWRRPQDGPATLIAGALGAAATLVAAFGLLARELSTSWQPMIVAAAGAHQLLWAAPLAVVLFALARRWYLLGPSGVILMLAVLTQAPLYIGGSSSDTGAGITVLQANLRVGSADPNHLTATVAARHVDVLMTEELTPTERDRLVAAGISRELPYRFDVAFDGGGGLAIWSRLPLTDEDNYPGFDLGVLRASLHVSAARTVTVFAVHLLPPYPYPAREWLTEMNRLRPLLNAAATDSTAVIVAGDFNATTDHAQFRRLLTHGYVDGAERSGAGYLASYPTDRWFPPLIAIDHVLTRNAPATSVRTLALPGSDHRALLAHLALAGP